MSWHMCGGQRTVFGSLLLLLCHRGPRLKVRSSVLVAGAYHWALSLVPCHTLKMCEAHAFIPILRRGSWVSVSSRTHTDPVSEETTKPNSCHTVE